MAQRMLALDLDGTTLNHMGELSDGVRAAIAALPNEVIVVVATGRSIIATTPILAALGIQEGLAVCANGAVTIDLNPAAPSGYAIAETVTFDPRSSRGCASPCPPLGSPSRSSASASR